MKNDRHLKIILTIIAICLVWICIRDIKIGGSNLHAAEGQFPDVQDVKIVGSKPLALMLAGPIEVMVTSLPNPSPVPQPEDK